MIIPTRRDTRVRAFADACYENALDELRAALAGPADAGDCRAWDLTPQEWRSAIELVLRERTDHGA